MEREVFESILATTVAAVTNAAKADFQAKIDELSEQIRSLQTPTQVIKYEPITIRPDTNCNETLDLVKSLPEFSGDASKYVSWRQAVFAAHMLFENYVGSSKYYQTVAIIRNKVVGSADLVLSSFNTVLNFYAIIGRLDFTYADKRPVHVLEQEMSLLRQGPLSLSEFYNEVEKKLSAIVNKVLMTNSNNNELASSLCQKYREDALRIFVSGLRKPMCDILFSSRPADLPSALALAQELECNRARISLVSSFNANSRPNRAEHTPYYGQTKRVNSSQQPMPMEVDPSLSRFNNRKTNNSDRRQLFPNSNIRNEVKEQYGSNRVSRNQKINHVSNDEYSSYEGEQQDEDSASGMEEVFENKSVGVHEEELDHNLDYVNFFGRGPSYHT